MLDPLGEYLDPWARDRRLSSTGMRVALVAALAGSSPFLPVASASARDVPLKFDSADGTVLEATLAIPDTPGKHPAALLIGGFGPHDRDGSRQSGMYRLWSDGLVARGIMTLRYDKRGTGSSGGRGLSWLDPLRLRDDIAAATRTLGARKELLAGHLSLNGHSQGGDLALSVAPRLASVSRVVTLAAPGRPLGDYAPNSLALVRSIVGDAAAESLATANPVQDAARVRQPVLLIQGLADRVVDPSDADRLLRARRRVGRPTAILRVPGVGHVLVSKRSGRPPVDTLERVVRFIK